MGRWWQTQICKPFPLPLRWKLDNSSFWFGKT
jgi:hypothetical protein